MGVLLCAALLSLSRGSTSSETSLNVWRCTPHQLPGDINFNGYRNETIKSLLHPEDAACSPETSINVCHTTRRCIIASRENFQVLHSYALWRGTVYDSFTIKVGGSAFHWKSVNATRPHRITSLWSPPDSLKSHIVVTVWEGFRRVVVKMGDIRFVANVGNISQNTQLRSRIDENFSNLDANRLMKIISWVEGGKVPGYLGPFFQPQMREKGKGAFNAKCDRIPRSALILCLPQIQRELTSEGGTR
jgi:hypothetical protein